MENPRPEKVAVVDEVREKLQGADAVLVTEYRGLRVSELAQLRGAMRDAGGEYKVYKNTLVRIAAREVGLDLDEILTGPTALALISSKPDGSPGDIATVAKAIQDFSKSQPLLVLKGGVLGESILDAAGAKALASLPTGPEIYSRLAGAINGNARGLASVVSGVHRSIAYVLQAAIDANAFAGELPTSNADSGSTPDESPTSHEPSDDTAEDAEAVASETTDADASTTGTDADASQESEKE